MPSYIVGDTHIDHDGKLYAPGEAIELNEKQAASLRVILAPAQAPSEEKDPTNKQLIEELTKMNVVIPKNATKPKLLELLEEARKAVAEKKDAQKREEVE